MSNDWRRKISRLLVGGVLLAGASLAVAAPWVVVTAERTSYKSGALLDDKTPIKLGEGAQLTLLAEDGKTLKLTGPYAGVPGNILHIGTILHFLKVWNFSVNNESSSFLYVV
jgi:hypothetical protein